MVMQTLVRSAFQLSIPPTQSDLCQGPEAYFASDISTHRRYKITADGKWFYPLQPEPRTLAQLAATPSPQDAALLSGFGFYTDVEPSRLWRVTADGSRYIPLTTKTVQLTGPYTLQATDDEAVFWSLIAVTVTVPPFTTFMPRCKFDCPSAGNISLVSSGGVLLNDATTTLTRARSANLAGFDLLPHYGEANSYGVSGA